MPRLRRVVETFRSNPRLVDGVIVVVLAITAVLSTIFVPPEGSERNADVWAVLLVLAAPVALWWRRTRPLLALQISAVFVFAYWIADYAAGSDFVLWIAFFSATRHGGPDRRRVYQVVGAVLAAVLLVATIGVIVPTEDLPAAAVLGLFFIHGTAAALGEALYQRRRYVAELEERARMLEADIENKAALAAIEERTRIARDMHDIIAHGMSAVVVQSQGAQRMLDTDPERAREALASIEAIGRTSVDEMRRMLGVLRDADGNDLVLEPQPGLEDFATLERHVAEAGVDVTITIDGARRELPPGLELTCYRVVQEALTNVMRHGGRPVRADAVVHFGTDSIEVTIEDDGLGAAALSATAGSGHGLRGMRERLEIYNGTIAAGPRPGGGYRVHAEIPIPVSSAGRGAAVARASEAPS